MAVPNLLPARTFQHRFVARPCFFFFSVSAKVVVQIGEIGEIHPFGGSLGGQFGATPARTPYSARWPVGVYFIIEETASSYC